MVFDIANCDVKFNGNLLKSSGAVGATEAGGAVVFGFAGT